MLDNLGCLVYILQNQLLWLLRWVVNLDGRGGCLSCGLTRWRHVWRLVVPFVGRACEEVLTFFNHSRKDPEMNRTLVFGISIFLVLVGISLLGGPQQAVAGHGCHGCHGCYGVSYHAVYRACHGSYGCYGGYSCYGSCYGGYSCWGGRRRHFHGGRRWHGGYNNCCGCWGSSGCYGDYGCYGGTGGVIIQEEEVGPTAPSAPAEAEPPADDNEAGIRGELGRRQFVSAFAAPARTSLTVRVPENAKVYLEGNATRSTGAVRQYATGHLEDGQEWVGYEVRVEIDQDGQKLVQRKTLTLKAGQTHEVSFDFDMPALAQTARR